MRLRLLAGSLLCIASGSAGALAAQSTAGQGAQVRIDYIEDQLPNGLKVLYHVDNSTPVAAVVLWYNVGSKMEAPGRTGFAHLFEHMMFQGSKNVAKGQHFALLEAAGGRGGADINGTTNTDRTNYFEQVPSNQLELALWLEADRMGRLLETVDLVKLDNQREVVKNERRQGVDNQPYGTWVERMQAEVFPAGHPYSHSVIGSMDDLSAATVADVHSFFKTYYAPNNAVLVIAGDIDVNATKALVRKHFGWIPRGPAVPPLANMTVPATIGTEKRFVVNDALAPAPAVFVAYRVPPVKETRAPVVDLLGSVVASGRTSRLYDALVRKQQVATQVSGFTFGFVDGADMLVFLAIGKPGASADSLEKALIGELATVGGTFTQADLDRVRAQERFNFVNGLQTTGGFGGRADRLAEGWTYHRDPNYVNKVLGAYDRVTLADLNALARERLVPTNRVIAVYQPVKKPAAPTTSSSGTK